MAKKTNKKTSKKTSKKTKEPSQAEQDNNLRKAEALKKIVEHNRDYLKLDLTLPLGDKALKQVHTNQWLFTDLPAEFDLVNWTAIAKALNSNVNRYEGYVENRWYIESCDISVDDSKAEMKLGLNAFASSVNSYSDAFKGFEKAYKDATSSNSSGKTTSASKNTTNAVASSENKTIKNGWWGKWVTEFVKKTVGNETDTLKKCKKMYNTFRDHVYYSRYCCACKTKNGNVNSYESAYKNGHLNCGDGANILCAFYECCGAKATIIHGPNHFVVKCTINGTSYWTDQSGAEGAHNTLRGWNQTYQGIKSGSDIGHKVTCGCYSC